MTAIPNYPTIAVQVEFVAGTWTTLPYVPTLSATRGRPYELATPQAGTMSVTIDCSDGALDPTNTGSPYYPNVKINKRARVILTWAGVTKALFTGFIERYPQRWDFAGSYQWTDLVVADALAPLGKVDMDPIAYHVINSYTPAMWWPLDDAAGSTVAGSRVGGLPLTPLTTRANGSTATGPFFGFGATQGAPGNPPLGMEGTSGAGFTPGPNALTVSPADMTVLRSPANTPVLPATGGWTVYCSWESLAPSLPSTSNGTRVMVLNSPDGSAYIAMGITNGNAVNAFVLDSVGVNASSAAVGTAGGQYLPKQGTWNNGVPHYSAVGLSADNKSLYIAFSDLGFYDIYTKNDGTVWNFSTLTSFSVGGEYRPNNNGNFSFNAWTGVVNNVAIFNADIVSTGGLNDIATAEMLGYGGEDTVARFKRLMAFGRPNITTGGSTAGNSAEQYPLIKGKMLAAAIAEVANDEFGTLYVDGDGNVTFTNRHFRVNPSSAFTFTDAGQDGSGVLRYTGVTTDFDDTRLLNDVVVKRNNGVSARTRDTASITDNGTYSSTVTTNITDDQQAIDRAAYTVGRYAQPLPRIAALNLDPGADPTLWPMVTSLDLNRAVTVVRTPALGHGFTRVCWVEQISYTADAATGAFTMSLQLSPADVNTYLVLDDPVLGKLDSGNKLAY